MTRKRGGVRAPRVRWIVAAALIVAMATIWFVVGLPANLTRGAEVRIVIPKGASFRQAAESLAAKGVVTSARAFAFYGRLRRHDRSLRWGTYVLHDAMSWEQVLTSLSLGRGVVHSLTIPEGWTVAEIVPAMADALEIPADSIFAAVRDTALRRRLDVPTPTIEGYLFPDTYTFPDRATARDAILTMVERFEQKWKPEWDSILPRLKLRRHDIVTLASIVEREVRRGEERPVVSAVYHNRLRRRMPLQADPTIDYALGRKPGRVLYKDLRIDSPYNTYRFPGLPPGPIGSPGAASIEAALKPANVPYLYFVAAADGHHEFRRTYAEHLAAIRMVRSRPARDSATDAVDTTARPAAKSKSP